MIILSTEGSDTATRDRRWAATSFALSFPTRIAGAVSVALTGEFAVAPGKMAPADAIPASWMNRRRSISTSSAGPGGPTAKWAAYLGERFDSIAQSRRKGSQPFSRRYPTGIG